jgi:hypothetical protein
MKKGYEKRGKEGRKEEGRKESVIKFHEWNGHPPRFKERASQRILLEHAFGLEVYQEREFTVLRIISEEACNDLLNALLMTSAFP